MLHSIRNVASSKVVLRGSIDRLAPKTTFIISRNVSKKTCLYEFHQERQARMESFAGYAMPIVYKNQSIKSEHLHTRSLASVFDVSHMMQTTVRGEDRSRFIESLTVADLGNMSINKCALSVFTNENGGIIDDCIIGKRDDHLHIVSNAGNAETVWSWLNSKVKDFDVKLERLDGRGLIALQGPKAVEVLQSLVSVELKKVLFMNTLDAEIKNIGSCQITRCGYTGEDGFEISVESNRALDLMNLLCSNQHVVPAGLGARDTLRLEAGLCLHGHDITDKTTPIEAALNWVIHKRRRTEGGFVGSQVVLEQLKSNTPTKRIGLVSNKVGPPAREGCIVTDGKSKVGVVTSGTFAPTLGKNIAMAYLPTNLSKEIGTNLNCVIRNKDYEYSIAKMPFVEAKYYIKEN